MSRREEIVFGTSVRKLILPPPQQPSLPRALAVSPFKTTTVMYTDWEKGITTSLKF
jgi:hypothetical protein